ncbi:MAG: radical SAM protein [Desulfovibrionaceae bacterium]|nr:radical SAM protein [Desulfovibrionaceae bacterium]
MSGEKAAQPLSFPHPEPDGFRPKIWPVFIPFAGCATRCLFCAQEAQTGARPRPLEELRREIAGRFSGPPGPGPAPELAFYGGTFTALPRPEQDAFMFLAARLKSEGLVSRVRCSTRPDAVNAAGLARLRAFGLDVLELGIQSFAPGPLEASRRGYAQEEALRGCRLTREAGLELGVQLMPGLPGMREEDFAEDIRLCLEARPVMVRLYPCLVLEGTGLAEEWRKGGFIPWSMDQVMLALPPAILALWERGIPVIRLGLCPEAELEGKILAGPRHPALGQMLRAQALFLYLSERLPPPEELAGRAFHVPRRTQGEFFGQRGALKISYARRGLDPAGVRWWDRDYFELSSCQSPGKQANSAQYEFGQS